MPEQDSAPRDDDDPMLTRLADLMRMALYEAGHHQANVFAEPSGVFVEGVDDGLIVERAFDLANDQITREMADA